MITHLVIGAGRMGGAMISGWTRGKDPFVDPANILVVDPSPGDQAQSVIESGAAYTARLEHNVATAQYVLLAIKPQGFAATGPELELCLPPGCVVISILAGTTLDELGQTFPNQHCVRCMPNTPAAIGKGITGFVAPESLSAEQREHVAQLLTAGGEIVELDSEGQIDTVTAISGSGPAYFFHMVEVLAAAGESLGLDTGKAQKLAAATLTGAGALLETSGQTAESLRKAVTSPGGTTQAALDVLMNESGLSPVLREAVQAAYHRSQELGKK